MTGRFMRADVAEEADVGAANDRLCEALTTPLHARIEDTPGDAARARSRDLGRPAPGRHGAADFIGEFLSV